MAVRHCKETQTLFQKSLKTAKPAEKQESLENPTSEHRQVTILSDQSVVCSVLTTPVTAQLAWNLKQGDTKKIPGTRYYPQWKTKRV